MRHGYAPTSSEETAEVDGLIPIDLETPDPACLDAPEREVSWARIYLLSLVNFGISAAWSLEMAVTTPYFASALGSGPVLSHVVWILGPLTGLVVAPTVGYLSDKCTSRLGRRRPFIIAGAVGTFVGMIVFSNARELAAHFFPVAARHTAAIVIAVVSFAVMDLSINTSMFPIRALQGDLVPEKQQHKVQSATVVMGGLGDLSLNMVVQHYNDPVLHLRFLFVLTAATYFVTSLTMLIFAHEEQYTRPPRDESTEEGDRTSVFRKLLSVPGVVVRYFGSLPGWLWRAGGAFSLGFFAFFCVLPNASTWLGSAVLQGDPEGNLQSKRRYEHGITAVGKAGVVRAALTVLTAAAYPRLLHLFSPGQLMGLAYLMYGVIGLLFAGTHNVFWGQFAVAAYAIPYTALLTIPPALTVAQSTPLNRGK